VSSGAITNGNLRLAWRDLMTEFTLDCLVHWRERLQTGDDEKLRNGHGGRGV